MHKRTMTYTDFNGTEVTEDFYFNLSKADIVKMQLSEKVGLHEHMTQVVKSNDGPKIVELFEKIVLMAYGVRTEDGRFVKSQEVRDHFASTAAYADLFVLLATDAGAAAEFINATMPPKQEMEQLTKQLSEEAATPELSATEPQLEQSKEPSDEELLAMDPQKMTQPQLIRAMGLKNKA